MSAQPRRGDDTCCRTQQHVSALKEYGINANITYVPQGQQCAPGRYTSVDRRLKDMGVVIGAERLSVTLPPGTVRDGVWTLEGYSAWPNRRHGR